MQITSIKVVPRIRTTGSIGYHSMFSICADVTDEQMVAHATKVCTTDRTINRDYVLSQIQQGNFIIERSAS